jgi:ERAP1-like C-terminal domain
LLDDSFNLAKSGYLDFNIALKLLKYVRREFELPPIAAGLKLMEFLYTYFDAEPFYKNLLDFIHETVDEIYIRINNSSHPEHPRVFSDNYHQVLKLRLNLFACRIGSIACTSHARSQMFMYDLQIRQPHADERPHLYCGALHGDLASVHWMGLKLRLMELTRNEELYRDNQEEISEILYAFSNCDSDVSRTERLLFDIFNKTHSLSYDLISREDASFVINSLIRASSKHREMVMDFYMNRNSIINST